MSDFTTITGKHWRDSIARARSEQNIALEQIATKLLVNAVETALMDVEKALAEVDESLLLVASDTLKNRQAMFTRALRVWRATLSRGDGSAHPEIATG
jgi:hypothetical protein